MVFRFWAFRRWVFPDGSGRRPESSWESAFTAGGIAEVFEDEHEAAGNVTPLHRSARRRDRRSGSRRRITDDQLSSDSSEQRVLKTS
jgi:hypothetical protein